MLRSQNPSASVVLQREHAPQLAALHAIAFHKGWSEDFFEQVLESSTGLAIGVFDNRRILIGFCLSRWVIDEGEVLTIVVNPADRHRGFGTSLLSTTRDYLRAKGIHKIFLEVAERNEVALSLYHKLGFKAVGLRRLYYTDTEETLDNAIVLELILNK
jgi:ribosomal-protein-alanine N-acetyltransferase